MNPLQKNNSFKAKNQYHISNFANKTKSKHKKKHRMKNRKKYRNKNNETKMEAEEDKIAPLRKNKKTVFRKPFNTSEEYTEIKKIVNTTNCISPGKQNCNEYFYENHNNELEKTQTKLRGNAHESYRENGNRSAIHRKPFKSHLNQFDLFGKHSEGNGSKCSANNAGCEGLCINLVGSFQCHCPPGFRLDSSGKKCLDINECIARNGHGPCQGECTNTWGSYRCSCTNLTGTKLANDGHSCEDIDECNSGANSLRCSHGCINTLGTAFCFCPEGYELGADWRTCQDVDECVLVEMQSVKCLGGCINALGSYKCL